MPDDEIEYSCGHKQRDVDKFISQNAKGAKILNMSIEEYIAKLTIIFINNKKEQINPTEKLRIISDT